jgi:hypothetical protein
MKLYKSYMFRDKDPAIDELRTVVQREIGAKISYKALKRIEVEGGPVVTTTSNWFFGKTKRPQNATLEAAGRALGYRRIWVKNKK